MNKYISIYVCSINKCSTVEPLKTVTSTQRPPPDLRSVKKVPAEFKVKLS